MPLSSFDEMDRKAARIVTNRLAPQTPAGGYLVSWLPQAAPPKSQTYTDGTETLDPTRPVRDGVPAIVTWRSQMIGAGATDFQSGLARGQLEDFDCVVDVESAFFTNDATGVRNSPIKGDIFKLAAEFAGNDLVQVDRDGDDGSQRLIFFCRLPRR